MPPAISRHSFVVEAMRAATSATAAFYMAATLAVSLKIRPIIVVIAKKGR
jgi:hypothetical protein